MKHLILFAGLLMLFTPNTHAGWFFDDPPPPPPDLGPEYRSKISKLEEQMSEQHVIADRWKIATGSLAFGALLLFVIGTALGAKHANIMMEQPEWDEQSPTPPRQLPTVPATTWAKQVHQIVIRRWQPEPLIEPVVDHDLPNLSAIERSAEVVSFTCRRPSWTVRRPFKFSCG